MKKKHLIAFAVLIIVITLVFLVVNFYLVYLNRAIVDEEVQLSTPESREKCEREFSQEGVPEFEDECARQKAIRDCACAEDGFNDFLRCGEIFDYCYDSCTWYMIRCQDQCFYDSYLCKQTARRVQRHCACSSEYLYLICKADELEDVPSFGELCYPRL